MATLTGSVAILKAPKDVLKIIVIEVEVGDATLIICPQEDGRQDVIRIATGEGDSSRGMNEVEENGFDLNIKPIRVFVVTHFDHNRMGDAENRHGRTS